MKKLFGLSLLLFVTSVQSTNYFTNLRNDYQSTANVKSTIATNEGLPANIIGGQAYGNNPFSLAPHSVVSASQTKVPWGSTNDAIYIEIAGTTYKIFEYFDISRNQRFIYVKKLIGGLNESTVQEFPVADWQELKITISGQGVPVVSSK